MNKKLVLKIVLGLGLTVVMIYLSANALGSLNPKVLLQRNIDWRMAGFSTLLFGLSQIVRSFVYPFGIDNSLSFGTGFRVVTIGNLANMFLPLRLGEGLRFAFFPHYYTATKRTEMIMIPGAADVVAILLISMVTVPLAGNIHPGTVQVLKIAAIILIVLAGLISFFCALVKSLRKKVIRLLTPGFGRMIGWVFCTWVLSLASTWLGIMAFHFSAIETARMAFAVFATSNLIMFIPSSPGGLGLFEYAVSISLTFFGMHESTAVPIALLLHAEQYVVLLPLGIIAYLSSLHLPGRAKALHKGT
ncbi:MAG TPA: hypothetical protein DEP42_06355 [Ruminococcaceae bacterium]|nr:hypothetical protein [Oscillospiraceae bacterium]